MNAWLESVSEEGILVSTVDQEGGNDGAILVRGGNDDVPLYLMINLGVTYGEGTQTYKYAVYAAEAFTYVDHEGFTAEIPAGWSELTVVFDESDEEFTTTVEAFTEETTFRFRNVDVVTVEEGMSAINGVVIGIVQGVAPTTYTITTTVTNGSEDEGSDTTINSDGTAEVDIVPDEGYKIDVENIDQAISVSGVEYWEYDRGTIYLYYPTGNVTVTVTCTALMRSITPSITNGSATGATEIQDAIGTASVTIVPGSGYTLPSSVSVSGASYTYDDTTGVIALTNATGDVSITATCPAALSPFSVSDVVTGVKFDTRLSSPEVNTICDNYVADTPTTETSVNVVEGSTAPIVQLSFATGEWALIVGQTTVWNKTNGWQNLDANGEIALASSDTVSQIATYYAEGVGGNGVVWGNA